ncbi:protein phosphatase 2C domain-containing protein [Candidatus Woesearchaeota archaeon]|nr:protein phosphatase 2C domain-containing protein [Candidatus Woesearchaeota archaeon]
MKAYIKEIPGRAHQKNEDSHYEHVFSDVEGKEWGLFTIADGLTDHNGTTASHLAIRVIRDQIEEIMKTKKVDNLRVLIKEAVVVANKNLESLRTATYTTLDIVLLSSEQLYVAHLGDSRVYLGYEDDLHLITPDEGNIFSGPKNYIGSTYIEGNSNPIEERIHLIEPYQTGWSKPRIILLTTDGLVTRATEEQIKKVCLNAGKYGDYSDVLNEFSAIIHYPKEKLLEFAEDDIRRKLLHEVSDFRIEKDVPKEELVDRILEAYLKGTSKELVDRIDGHLKFDDTSLILVDLNDTVTRSLAEFREMEQILFPTLRKERDDYADKLVRAQEAVRTLEGSLLKEEERREEEKMAYAKICAEKEEMIAQLAQEVTKYQSCINTAIETSSLGTELAPPMRKPDESNEITSGVSARIKSFIKNFLSQGKLYLAIKGAAKWLNEEVK